MKLTTDQLKHLITTKFMLEPESVEELRNRHGHRFPAGYLDPKVWKRHTKCVINSLDEQESKIGFSFINPKDGLDMSDAYKLYAPITFPCTYRLFVCMPEQWKGADEDCPDDTCLGIVSDAKDENVLYFGFNCD